MRSFGSITMKHACSISARPMWNGSCCTRIIRPSTSTVGQTPSGAGTPRRITPSFRLSLNRSQTPARFSLRGPANAKTELVKHISQHDPRLMRIIVGVETVDHPSDAQLVAHARHYFKAEDRMLPAKELSAVLGLVFGHHRRSMLHM